MIEKIEDTNKESLRAKKSAALKGYFRDDYISYFCPNEIKKEIILNRGYWVRVHFFR